MNCPKCKNIMVKKGEDVTSNIRDGKQYDKTAYWCEVDDIWISIEVPKENS